MTCCSGRRAAAVAAPFLAATPAPRPRVAEGGELLVYTGATPIALRGPASGRVYNVRPGTRPVEADLRDVEALIRCGLFARVLPTRS